MLKVSELVQATAGATTSFADFAVNNICTDSRAIKAGDAFVALVGEQFDGHSFCQTAINNGAKVLVVQKELGKAPADVVVILVCDTLQAYQQIANFYRNKFSLPVVAVTGSTGKTSTKDIIACALGASKKVLKSQGNFNNEIGLPATLLNLNDSYEVAVVEMGMRGLGQIEELALIAQPTVGVVTNVGNTHIELLETIDNIAKAKGELIEALGKQSFAILNFDDAYVRNMANFAKGTVISFGLSDDTYIQAKDIVVEGTGIVFTCENSLIGDSFVVRIPLLGKHNVYNALAAIAVCFVLNIPKEKMLEGLSNAKLSNMRQAIEQVNEMIFIDDTYNASPSSMKASLEMLCELQSSKKIAVLGDMLELGDVAEVEHQALGKLVAQKGFDVLVTYGTLSAFTTKEALANGVDAIHCFDYEEASIAVFKQLEKNAVVLFKGSRGMYIEKIIGLVKEKII